jgi:hypothetical protein
MKFLYLVLCLIIQGQILAQETLFIPENQKAKTVIIYRDSFLIDTAFIQPKSVQLKYKNNFIDATKFINFESMYFHKKSLKLGDTIYLSYKVFPKNIQGVSMRKSQELITSHDFNAVFDNAFYQVEDISKQKEIEFSSLDYNGVFGRGLSFGNNQDVILNSQFNLQLNGKIGNDIEILAAITDNQLPLQPAGNTQQIQDFDKIFIQFKRKKNSLIVGDYDLKLQNDYFLRLNRNLQGIKLDAQIDFNENTILKNSTSLAISRGSFAVNNFQGVEGNQGPYKLRGNNAENFIIILAGSEKVYIDGIPMKRGEDNDYIIDYNLGEISFTPNKMITKDVRIRVEFEYTDRQYFRSLLSNNLTFTHKKNEFYFSALSIQDSKNQTLDRTLTSLEKQRIANVGDNINTVLLPSYQEVQLNANDKVLYMLKDTIDATSGIAFDSVFVASNNQNVRLYTVVFTDLGLGNGNYIKAINSSNGRTYEWKSPINGIKQGNFEPVVKYAAPKLQQIFSFGGKSNIGKNAFVMYNTALSKNDINRFASIDKANDIGLASSCYIEKKWITSYEKTKYSEIISGFRHEFSNVFFQFFEPYRVVEFNRNWNINSNKKDVEHLSNYFISFQKTDKLKLKYEISNYLNGKYYKGINQIFNEKIDIKQFQIISMSALLLSSDTITKTQFFRPNITLQKTFKKLLKTTVGVNYNQEQNKIKFKQTNNLSPKSFDFNETKFFIQTNDSSNINTRISFMIRDDKFLSTNRLKLGSKAYTTNFEFNYKTNLILNIGIRKLNIIDTNYIKPSGNERSLLARLDYNGTIKKGLLRWNTAYQINGSQEPKLEFTYLQVRAGEGNYTWNDYNGDGIAQINEFEISYFTDRANYIKISNVSNEYLQTRTLMLNQNVQINLKTIIKNETKWQKILREFSNITTWQIERKIINNNNSIADFNPFYNNIPDSILVTLKNNFRNSLYYNRASQKFSLEITFNNNQFKNNLINGSELSKAFEQIYKVRIGLAEKLLLNITQQMAKRIYDAQYFNTRDYKIDSYKTEPELVFTWKSRLRILTSYRFEIAKNTIQNREKLIRNQMQLDAKYSIANSYSISANIAFIKNKFDGNAFNSVGYVMLNGLQQGNNYVWNIGLNKKLSKSLELTITYDGRKAGQNTKIVHAGQAQIRAIF